MCKINIWQRTHTVNSQFAQTELYFLAGMVRVTDSHQSTGIKVNDVFVLMKKVCTGIEFKSNSLIYTY